MSVHAVNHPADLQRMTPLGQLARNVTVQKIGAVLLDEIVNTEAPALRSIPEDIEVTTPEDPKNEGGRAAGVLRNLEAGHFKGVADVRLRINFFDQLSTRAETAAGAVIEEQSQGLVESIAAKVDELVGPFATDQETRTALETLVANFGTAVEEAASGSTLDRDALAGALQSAFGELVTRMADLLSAQAEAVRIAPNESGEAVDASDAQTAPTTPTLEEAIASLGNIFEEALAGLLASVSAAALPREPAQPSGNGVAYDRFLAIYNGLRGLTPTIDERV